MSSWRILSAPPCKKFIGSSAKNAVLAGNQAVQILVSPRCGRNWRCQMKAKTSAAALGLVGGLALGVWIGSEMTSGRGASTLEPAAVAVQAAEPAAATPQPEQPKRVQRAARARVAAAVEAPAPESAPKLVMTIPVSAPELHARLKPVLARGTKLPVAVEGFTSAEQFATLAHAAKNTQVPFILLKHRVLSEGQSLEQAIRASKPDLDAKSEVARARTAAKEDLAAVSAVTPSSASTRSNPPTLAEPPASYG